jgi:phage gp45-like
MSDQRDRESSLWTMVRNAIRRMVVEVSGGYLWQLGGHEDEGEDEVPAFQGIGFASRPPAGSAAAEAILVKIEGASGRPVIVATHDEDLRRVHEAVRDMDPDEVAIFNAGALVKITSDGDVTIVVAPGRRLYVSTDGGSTDQLVTKTDFLNHAHAAAGAVGTPTLPTPITGSFSYTAALESE